MIRCADGSLFTGVCDDPDEAVCEFNQGNLSKYVASRLPVLLVYSEEFMNEKDAVKRAIRIRRLGKMQKEILINEIPRFLVSV